MKAILLAALALSTAALAATPASAATVIDPTGDFLPTYTGPRLGDLDVTSFSVAYDRVRAEFVLGATFAAAIDPATAGFYVFGVNTGRGAFAPFAAIGQGRVTFDQAIVVNKNGTGSIGAVTLDPAVISITGNILTTRLAASLLPSTGAGLLSYGFNLWPRSGPGQIEVISDFAPDNALLATVVPEPATWTTMLLGFAAIGLTMRARRRGGEAVVA